MIEKQHLRNKNYHRTYVHHSFFFKFFFGSGHVTEYSFDGLDSNSTEFLKNREEMLQKLTSELRSYQF